VRYRTTALLRKALTEAKEGKRVFFVVYSGNMIPYVLQMLKEPRNASWLEGATVKSQQVDFPDTGGCMEVRTRGSTTDRALLGQEENVTIIRDHYRPHLYGFSDD